MASRAKTIAFAIEGPLTRDDLPRLRARVRVLLRETGADVAFCDVGRLDRDAVTVDVLCRLQLAAKRHGCQIRLRNASAELRELVDFMGLQDVLPE